MIIKSNNMPTGDCINLGNYVLRQGENEALPVVLFGDPHAQAYDATALASAAMVKYGMRHVQISPSKILDKEQLMLCVQRYLEVHEIDEGHEYSVTLHTKQRADEADSHHLHLLITQCHSDTLKTLNTSYTKMKNERLSRELEVRFGENQVRGRWGKAAMKYISDDQTLGELERAEIVSKMRESGLHSGDIGMTQYRSSVAQRAKRKDRNFSLPVFALAIKRIITDTNQPKSRRQRLLDAFYICSQMNVKMKFGRKPGYLLFEHEGDILSSLNRVAKISVAEMGAYVRMLQSVSGEGQTTITKTMIEKLPLSISEQNEAMLSKLDNHDFSYAKDTTDYVTYDEYDDMLAELFAEQDDDDLDADNDY